VLGVKFMQMQ